MILGNQFLTAGTHAKILQNHAKSVVIDDRCHLTLLSGYISALNNIDSKVAAVTN